MYNAYGEAKTNTITFEIISAPTITEQSQNLTVHEGHPVEFYFGVNGEEVHYTWTVYKGDESETYNENGAEGLRPHLTADAQTTLDNINAFADNKIVNAIVGLLDMKDDITVLKEKLQQTKWDVVDIMKGENNAVAILSFKYDEDLSGTMEISMIKEEKEWKIDSLQLPEFN